MTTVAPLVRGTVEPATGSVSKSISKFAPPLLPPSSHRIGWILMAVTHGMVGISRLLVAASHIFLAIPAVHAGATLLQVPQGVLMATGCCMGVVSCTHFVLLSALVRRLRRPDAATEPSTRKLAEQKAPQHVERKNNGCSACLQTLQHIVRGASMSLASAIDRFFGINGIFGVNGRWFFVFFEGLEALELLSQTYQAYQLSRFVQSSVIKSIMVTMIFFNGFLPPLTLFFMRKNPNRLTRRLAVFVLDLVLDLVYAEAIPGVALLPLIAAYDWKIRAFPAVLALEDVWATNAVSLVRFVLVTSYMDLITTLVPHVNFLIGVQTVKTLLTGRLNAVQSSSSTPVTASKPQGGKRAKDGSFVFRVVAFLWGATVVGLHIDAGRNLRRAASIPSCKLPLAPWRIVESGKSPCAVMYINCYRRGITGTMDEIESVLQAVELDAISTLAFGHCSQLELPSMVRHLSKLVGFEIFNSTLIKWDHEAALTQTHHPLMHHVYLVHTNLTALPDGLMHDSLPRGFQYFHLYDTNLTRLPDTVDQIWGRHQWVVLGFINTPLQLLPDDFSLVCVDDLHLLNTKIARFSDATARILPRLSRLRISGVDFHELPSRFDVPAGHTLLPRGLFIQNTSVETLPTWTVSWLDQSLAADRGTEEQLQAAFFGSPVCASPAYSKYSRFCKPDIDFDMYLFPYDIIAAQRLW